MDRWNVVPLLLVLAATASVSSGQVVGDSEAPESSRVLAQLASTVKASASDSGLTVAFVTHASDMLLEWEANAPEKVKAEIAILREGDDIPSAEAADRLARMGGGARGASLALIKTLGNAHLIMPGDIPRLFGAKPFTPGTRAASSLSEMGEWGVVPLILATCKDFGKEDSRDSESRNALAFNALELVTRANLPQDAESWINWFVTNPTSLAADEPDTEERNDVGHIAVPRYIRNEFFWALVVGGVIVIVVRWIRRR